MSPRMVAEGIETVGPVLVKDIVLSGTATGWPTIAASESNPVATALNEIAIAEYQKIAETILAPGNHTLKIIIQCDTGTTGNIRLYDLTGKAEIINFDVSNNARQIITQAVTYSFTQPDNIVEVHAKRIAGEGSIYIGSINITKVEV